MWGGFWPQKVFNRRLRNDCTLDRLSVYAVTEIKLAELAKGPNSMVLTASTPNPTQILRGSNERTGPSL